MGIFFFFFNLPEIPMPSQGWDAQEQRARETPVTFLSVGGRWDDHSFRFWGDFPKSGMHLLPCEGPLRAGGPRKVVPGCSHAGTPAKACRELRERGDATGAVSGLRICLSFLKAEGAQSRPLGSRLRRKGWGGRNPVSAQPPSGKTPAVHLKVPAPLARGKTLASPDLGFQPSPSTASTPRQHPSKSRGGRVPVWVWFKKRLSRWQPKGSSKQGTWVHCWGLGLQLTSGKPTSENFRRSSPPVLLLLIVRLLKEAGTQGEVCRDQAGPPPPRRSDPHLGSMAVS